jgi:hypothetical protein
MADENQCFRKSGEPDHTPRSYRTLSRHHLKDVRWSGTVLLLSRRFFHFSNAMIEEIQLDFQHTQFCRSKRSAVIRVEFFQ